MRVFYHNARKLRQLQNRLKKAYRILKDQKKGEALPISVRPILVKIRKILKSIVYLPKSKLAKLSAFGFILTLSMNVSAQQFLPPIDIDYNLAILDLDSLGIIYNHQFIDVDNDGDLDCFYEYFDGTPISEYLTPLIYFQENISDAVIKFDEPQNIFNANETSLSDLGSLSLVDIDKDGDIDLYSFGYNYGNYYYYEKKLLIFENVSNQAKVFDFNEPLMISGFEDIYQPVLEFTDLDMDGDQDLLFVSKDYENYYNQFLSNKFVYLENNGTLDTLYPFDTIINNPFNLDNVLQIIGEDSIKIVVPADHQLFDIDDDGDEDLVFDAFKYDYNYNNQEYKMFYFENIGTDQPLFAENMQVFASWPFGTNLSNPADTLPLNKWHISNFQDLDNDGDFDAIVNQWILNDSVYTNNYYLIENIQNEATKISGLVFADINSNGSQDAEENSISNQVIHFPPYLTTTNNSGEFSSYLGDGNFTVSTQAPPAWIVVPENYEITTGLADTIANLDFALQPISQQQDLRIDAIGFITRRGFDTRYKIKASNFGTTIEDVEIVANFDEDVSFISADIAPSNINGNRVTWTIDDFSPFEIKYINIDANITLNSALGDTLCSVFSITPEVNDIARANNIDTLKQIVIGSFDPNDKQVQPLGEEEDGAIPPSTDLFSYTIQFQNTGTDTAFNVVIVDTIDIDLDLNTFEMVAASHEYTFEVNEERQAKWTFSNILLPDSTIDLAGSNGYIQYDIKPVEDKPLGTQFTNSADIYFDFNDPIKTNTTINTYRIILGLRQSELLTFELFPNPTSEKAVLQFENPNQQKVQFELYDINGRLMLQEEVFENQIILNKNQLANGIYTFSLKVGDELGSGKVIFK